MITDHTRRDEGSVGTFSRFENGGNVVFFGNTVSVECQRCNAYSSTNKGHKYCVHVTCPLALKEFKRRQRKRTSTLEREYMSRGPDGQ